MHVANACSGITITTATGTIAIADRCSITTGCGNASHTSRYVFGAIGSSACLIDAMLHHINVEKGAGLERIAG